MGRYVMQRQQQEPPPMTWGDANKQLRNAEKRPIRPPAPAPITPAPPMQAKPVAPPVVGPGTKEWLANANARQQAGAQMTPMKPIPRLKARMAQPVQPQTPAPPVRRTPTMSNY